MQESGSRAPYGKSRHGGQMRQRNCSNAGYALTKQAGIALIPACRRVQDVAFKNIACVVTGNRYRRRRPYPGPWQGKEIKVGADYFASLAAPAFASFLHWRMNLCRSL